MRIIKTKKIKDIILGMTLAITSQQILAPQLQVNRLDGTVCTETEIGVDTLTSLADLISSGSNKVSAHQFLEIIPSATLPDEIRSNDSDYVLTWCTPGTIDLTKDIYNMQLIRLYKGHLLYNPGASTRTICDRLNLDSGWYPLRFDLAQTPFPTIDRRLLANRIICALYLKLSAPDGTALRKEDFIKLDARLNAQYEQRGKTKIGLREQLLEQLGEEYFIKDISWDLEYPDPEKSCFNYAFGATKVALKPDMKFNSDDVSDILDLVSLEFRKFVLFLVEADNQVPELSFRYIEHFRPLMDSADHILDSKERGHFDFIGLEIHKSNFYGFPGMDGYDFFYNYQLKKNGDVFELWFAKQESFSVDSHYVDLDGRLIFHLTDPNFGRLVVHNIGRNKLGNGFFGYPEDRKPVEYRFRDGVVPTNLLDFCSAIARDLAGPEVDQESGKLKLGVFVEPLFQYKFRDNIKGSYLLCPDDEIDTISGKLEERLAKPLLTFRPHEASVPSTAG